MNEMVERVARVVCRQANLDDGYADDEVLRLSMEQGMWRNHLEQARAAIAAMREPTEAMVKAGIDGVNLHVDQDVDHEAGGFYTIVDDAGAARGAWQAMIDAALADQ